MGAGGVEDDRPLIIGQDQAGRSVTRRRTIVEHLSRHAHLRGDVAEIATLQGGGARENKQHRLDAPRELIRLYDLTGAYLATEGEE